MKRINNKVILILVIGIISASVFTGCSNTDYKNSDYSIKFMTNFGDIGMFPGEKGLLNLRYVVENHRKYEEERVQRSENLAVESIPNVELDNPELIVTDVKIDKAYEYKDFALYSLNIDVEAKTVGEFAVKNVIFGDKTYPIGDIVFECKEIISDDTLIVKDATALSYGRGINDYSLTLKNKSGQPITIYKATNKKYKDANLKTFVGNDNKREITESFISTDDKDIIMTISFTVPNEDDFDAYFFTPEIEYEYNGKRFSLKLYPLFCGVSISDQEFIQMCIKMEESAKE